MAQWILKANGKIVLRCTLRPLLVEDLHNPIEIKKQEIFDSLIKKKWGDSITLPPVSESKTDDWEEYEDEVKEPRKVPDIEDIVDKKGNLLDQQPAYNKSINSEVNMQIGDKIQHEKVV